jgi:hypothetical protein
VWCARLGDDGLGDLHAEDRIGVGHGREAHRVCCEGLETLGERLGT